MSSSLLKRIERFREQRKIPILTLCKMMDVHNVTYHRWRNAGKITGAYKKIVEAFLAQHEQAVSAVNEPVSNPANRSNSQNNSSDIAVIGIACYYPGASSPSELWENILGRRVQFRRMLDQRLPLGEYYDEDPKAPEKTYLTKAAFLENFNFDWGRLRIPKKTVESTDIAHWLALDIALKTFEDAGYKLSEIPLQNTGVIVGNTLTGEQTRSQTLRLRWPFVQKALNATLGHLGKSQEERSQIAAEMEKIYKSAFYPVTEDSLAGGLANTIAGRICNYLNLKGGGYIVDGACSSSLLAVATAADALKMGNMDLALAGGVDISLDPFELVGFAKAGALAKDQMRVYDQKANGFLPGEGCGFVLLKRLSDALRDKNYVYATIKGWGISSDGKGGIMEPSSSGQSFAIGRAYKDLDYKISDVDFVEGHGTGTTKGDRVELEGIAAAIDKTIKKENKDKRGCGVTSFKSIVGHTKAAAGIGGLLKAVMAVNQHILPPTANCTHPNDVFKDAAKNMFPIILGGRLPLDRKSRAGISSAGFGGINCHLTLESGDKPKAELRSKLDERALFVSHQQTEVFIFSSRTTVHLEKIIQKFKVDLRNISIAEMADLAALLNKKVKPSLPIKAAIVTDSPEHLYDALILLEKELDHLTVGEGQLHRIKSKDPNTEIIFSNKFKKSRIGFLYPGQGSQRLNMTRILVHRYQWAREMFRLSSLPLFEKVYLATDKFFTREDQQEFDKQLSDTRITQPAVVLSSMIWTEFFSKLGIEPQICVGHSLGELTAFYKAGAFNKETLIKFAQLRGELMSSEGNSKGSMASLSCSKAKAGELIKKISGNIVIANINSPHQTVVSGGNKEIEHVMDLAKQAEISAIRLNVSNAFHSTFMKSASDKIKNAKILPDTFKNNGIKIYSCMSGKIIHCHSRTPDGHSRESGNLNLREYFSKQMISPVDFVGVIESAAKECDLMIEMGPGRVLTDLVKATAKDMVCLPTESSSGNDRDLNIVLAEIFVRNVPVKWEEFYRNRLIRTFVPASRKKFIENQCEHPLKIGGEVLTNKFSPVLLQVAEEDKKPEEIIPGGLPEVKGRNHIENLLINLTHKMTGFDLESISLNLMLLDDLNLDSIKAAELIGQAARTLGVAGQLDPSQLSNNTLEQIADRLYVLSEQSKAGVIKETVTDILKRYQDKQWVRNFVPDLRAEEIKTKNVNQLKALKNIVFLAGKDEEGLVRKVEKEFKVNKVKKEKSDHIDCLIAILPKNMILCHPERSEGSKDFNKESLKSIIENLHQFTDLATSNRLDKDSFVVLVQFGGGGTALASTLFLERPDLKVRIIDFDEKTDEGKISEKIIDELQTYEDFSSIKYDAQLKRYTVYYENSEPSGYKKRAIAWSNKDVVLVTGGAKGITAQCALEFARSTKAQMVLVGRSPFPKDKNDEANEIIQTLKQFESEKLKSSYFQCDVTNEKDVISTIKDIEKKLGKITGFVHGAGLNSLKRLKQASVEEAYKEALPKVLGAVNICNALKDHPPKLIVGITSIIGLTGMEGSGWYGLANEILNLYLHSHKTQIVTIAYSVWDEVGMGAKLGSVNRLAEKGIGAIPVKEGIKHFRQLIEADPGAQQVIVAARVAGIATWRSAATKPNNLRFIEKVEYSLPGIELIARADLNVEDDPYLLDHNWKGSLLFPFVFGFEAMAQAVACVLGIDKFDHIQAHDINLQRPIPVPQDTGTTIEIHAQVLEQGKSGRQVKVEIYSQESAYKEPHFSAIFEVGGVIARRSEATKQSLKKATNVIDLDPQTDLYGPILFQGKLFQCIEQIHELYYDEAAKKGECVFTSAYNRSAEEFLKENKKFNKRFSTGDPFFIDSMLQSMQLIVSQNACLPIFIKEIWVTITINKEKSKLNSHTFVNKVSNNELIGNSSVQYVSGLGVYIRNCRLRILDYFSEKPSANDLVDPTQRDRIIIESKLNELAQQMGCSMPIVRYMYDLRLKMATKEQRHKIETPFIQSIINELFFGGSKRLRPVALRWLNSGRPILVNKDLNNVQISLSHCDGSFICVIGDTEQGCDIENIVRRSEKDWLTLLGRKKFLLLRNLIDLGFDLNLGGTIVWCAFEAFKKVFNRLNFDFQFIDYYKDQVIFGSDENGIQVNVCCMAIQLTRCAKVFSCSINTIQKPIIAKLDSDVKTLRKIGFNENQLFGVNVDYSGPQKQLVMTQRFPVTFKTNQMLSRRVYFTNFFDWIGTIRENSVYPTFKALSKLAETGEWGLVTNLAELRILGGIKSGDIIEAKIWGGALEGNKRAITPMEFEWFRITDGGRRERVAVAKQNSTWVSITKDHSVVIERMPKFLSEYFDLVKPMTDQILPREICPEPYKRLNLGDKIKSYRVDITSKFKISEGVFSTTLENSNLMGNIYFANYAKWLGVVEDKFFYNLIPSYFVNINDKNEILCLECNIYYLNDAFPFENILVEMFLDEVFENGIKLYFEFYRIKGDKKETKLAYANQQIVFVHWKNEEDPEAIKVPKIIKDAFKSKE